MRLPESTTQAGTPKNRNLLLICGGLFLVFFHLILWRTLPARHGVPAILWILIGLLVAGYGLKRQLTGQKADRISIWVDRAADRISFSPIRLTALILAVLFAITCSLAAGFSLYMINTFVALVSWGAAIGLTIFVAWERKPAQLSIIKPLALPFCIVFLTAFLLRGLDLTTYPSALSGDEAAMGLSSTFFLSGIMNNPFITGWYSFPSMYYFIQSFGIALLGQTTIGLRITAALVGTMTVTALFLVMRAMFNDRAALTASLLLAFSNYHIHFSRLGLNNIWDGLSWLLTLGLLWWAWNHERRAAFAAAGLFLGLSQYFYVSARGLFIAVPFWLLIVSLQDPKRFRRCIPDIFLMGISMLVVFLPLAWFYINEPAEFQAPMQRVTILGNWLGNEMVRTNQSMLQVLATQFIASLNGLTVAPFRHAWYESGYPLLRPASAVLFYLGSGLLVIRWKDTRLSLTAVWLGTIIITGALSTDPPAAQRYVAAAPACFMVIGYGIDKTICFLERLIPQWKKAVSIFSLVLVLITGMEDAGFYFYEYSPNSNFGGYPTQVSQSLADDLKEYDATWEVFFSGWPQMGYHSILTANYLVPQIKVEDINKPWGDPSNPVPNKKKLIFVFLPARKDDLEKCMEQYPGGELITRHGYHQTLYYLYNVEHP